MTAAVLHTPAVPAVPVPDIGYSNCLHDFDLAFGRAADPADKPADDSDVVLAIHSSNHSDSYYCS